MSHPHQEPFFSNISTLELHAKIVPGSAPSLISSFFLPRLNQHWWGVMSCITHTTHSCFESLSFSTRNRPYLELPLLCDKCSGLFCTAERPVLSTFRICSGVLVYLNCQKIQVVFTY
jgi:hypothetical protein